MGGGGEKPHLNETVVEMEADEAGENALVRVPGLLDDPSDDARQVGARG